MSHGQIPYEAAFEHYLRSRGVPYVSVGEAPRMIFAGAKIKSFDFLVYPSDDRHWIVDLKGRRFPYVSGRGAKRYWENWITQGDLDGLAEWETLFGEEFGARLVFAYLLAGPPDRWPAVRPHRFRGEDYAFLAVALADYRRYCRRRSPKWQTVAVPKEAFRQIARPMELWCVQK